MIVGECILASPRICGEESSGGNAVVKTRDVGLEYGRGLFSQPIVAKKNRDVMLVTPIAPPYGSLG